MIERAQDETIDDCFELLESKSGFAAQEFDADGGLDAVVVAVVVGVVALAEEGAVFIGAE